MSPIRLTLALVAALLPLHANATQTGLGFATLEDFETYAPGPRSIPFCPGSPGDDNAGVECGFGTLVGGSVATGTAQFPAVSGSQVYVGTQMSLEGMDAEANSWPGISALVSSGDAAVTLSLFAFDYELGEETEFFTTTIAANLTNELFSAGTGDNPIFLTRFVFTSPTPFAIDDLQIGLADTPPGIPEPASWLMLLIGFGSVGSAMRRRRPSAA